MEYFVKLLVFVICCVHVAYTIKISEVQAKIEAESQIIDGAIGASRSAIYQHMTSSRSGLNIRAESLKTEISNGLVNCKVYSEQIRSIQEYQVNFVYEYQPCEYVVRLNKMVDYKTSLGEQKKISDLIATLCERTGAISRDCQAQIDLANADFDTLHTNAADAIAGINNDVAKCIPNKQAEINNMMDSVYDAWKNCQIV